MISFGSAALALRRVGAFRVKCSWISSPITWLTEPRSASTLATFLAIRAMKLASAAYTDESESGTRWNTCGSCVWPYRSMRPMRCSSRDGLNGMSKLTSRWQ